jgi:hypothetical protein
MLTIRETRAALQSIADGMLLEADSFAHERLSVIAAEMRHAAGAARTHDAMAVVGARAADQLMRELGRSEDAFSIARVFEGGQNA